MNSESLEEYGFKGWYPLNKITVSDVPYKQSGVYAIKLKTALERKIGKSDILYVGSSDNLSRRIFGNHLGGVGGKTTQRIHKSLFEEGYLEKTEISWVITENRGMEKDLRFKYFQEHKELPLWNKQL